MSEEKKVSIQREISFRWLSKHELYSYFGGMYNISRNDIDKEVETALLSFKLRMGKPIDPKELWQKVGMTIEHRLARPADDTTAIKIEDVIKKKKQRKRKK